MATSNPDLLWLIDLEADGGLESADRQLLEREVAGRSGAAGEELAMERHRLERLHALLAADRVPVRAQFRQSVMAALPVPPWHAQGVGAWRFALGLLAALVVLTIGIAAFGAPQVESSPLLGVLAAAVDFAVATTLSGAGMLSASWRGLGMALGDALGVPQQVIFGIGVAAINGLLFTLLRSAWRRREVAVEVEGR